MLILGESGTGKELVARAIHHKSDRAKGPFLALNCAALPKDILENELFGHEKGAFTGSTNEKPGAFEMADGGTLFLDEVGEMATDIQVKLLRALESRSVRRLGGKKEIPVDIRVVAATNKNLQRALEEGELREDLYYRLAVVEIELPPLRERVGDIKLLATEFLSRFARENNKKILAFDDDAIEWILRHNWPGQRARAQEHDRERGDHGEGHEHWHAGHHPASAARAGRRESGDRDADRGRDPCRSKKADAAAHFFLDRRRCGAHGSHAGNFGERGAK